MANKRKRKGEPAISCIPFQLVRGKPIICGDVRQFYPDDYIFPHFVSSRLWRSYIIANNTENARFFHSPWPHPSRGWCRVSMISLPLLRERPKRNRSFAIPMQKAAQGEKCWLNGVCTRHGECKTRAVGAAKIVGELAYRAYGDKMSEK